MAVARKQLVGTMQAPGSAPQNIELAVSERPILTESELSGGIQWVDQNYDPGVVWRYGGDPTGATDSSEAFQRAVDGNKGGLVVIPEDTTLLGAGALLSGSTYDNTSIHVRGTFKLAASAGANNFQSACWAGIIVHDCDNVTVEIHDSDGNRANQAAKEQTYILLIAGASNYRIPIFHTREIRGDGIHIAQKTLTSDTTEPINGYIGTVSGINSADDGRNLISVISANGLMIDSVYSIKIGGTIGVTLMPGGLDIEPDQGYQNCENIVVGSLYVETAGQTGCAVLGKAVTNDATRDWNAKNISIDQAIVQKTGTTGAGLAAVTFARLMDCEINLSVYYATTKGKGIAVDYGDRITGTLRARNVTQGVAVGTAEELRDSELECFVSDYSVAGLRPCEVTRCTFTGRIYESPATGTPFAIQCHDEGRVGGATQTDVIYKIDAPHDSNNSRAFRNETGNTVSYTNCVIRDCDYTGYTSPPVTVDAEIFKVNVRGMNWASSIPTSGTWFKGDLVWNTNPVEDANQMIQMGWVRLTTGTGNTVNTDWEYMRFSTVSPASP